MRLYSPVVVCGILLLAAIALWQDATRNLPQFDGSRALEYTRQYVNATGPRWIGSPGHAKAETFLKSEFRRDDLVEDTFTTNTPAGPMTMHNFLVKFPGKKDGIIVLASHYETNYPLRNIHYVGANDGGSTTGLLIEAANYFRGKPNNGYSVWLFFTDGEEAIKSWSDADSVYGSKHLAAQWQADGTLKHIKAFLLVDMLGDKDLDVQRDLNSTPWLEDLVYKAASDYGWQSYFFGQQTRDEDDHIPFVKRGVPCADLIDLDYGYNNAYWHTDQDTLDKLSAKSLTIAGDTLLETIRLLNQR
ncbi:MAG TPA: M28 family peptidase [Acidobacteriaceae bacterium]|nr:M28 family peptidase [Acidobacteriaceae bacterium]